jgi:predicted AAA+ superfamily ATPase
MRGFVPEATTSFMDRDTLLAGRTYRIRLDWFKFKEVIRFRSAVVENTAQRGRSDPDRESDAGMVSRRSAG